MLRKPIIIAFLAVCMGSAQAIPLQHSGQTQKSPGLGRMPMEGAANIIPPEVVNQFSGEDIASLPQAVLAAKSAELRDRLAKFPNNPAVMHALGNVSYQQGLHKEAVALWEQAHKRDANLAPAELMRDVQEMFSLMVRGEKKEAQKKLVAMEASYAKEPHFYLLRAEQAMRGGNAKAAGVAYQRAYELGPTLYVTSLNLARYDEAIGRDAAETERLFRLAASLAPEKIEVWTYLGAFQFRQKQPKAALESLNRARSLDPSLPLPEVSLAELAIRQGDYAAAREWYMAALANKPTKQEVQAIRSALGDVLMRLGRLSEARLEIETALKSGEYPPLLFALGTIDEAEGRLSDAETRYRRVLELMPDNPLPANNLAMLLIRTDKQAKEALRLAEQARQALPDNAIIESTYGCALAQTGRSADAVKVLEPVVKATPKDAWAHYCLGKSLLRGKRPEEAKKHLTQALQVDTAFPLRAQVEKILAGIQ